MGIIEEMTPLAEVDVKKLNNEGCIRLMCQIGQLAAEEYRDAYANYITRCMESDADVTREARAKMKSSERRLKGTLLNLSESQIVSLQMQVEKSTRFANFKGEIREMYFQGYMSRDALSKHFGLLPSILKRWLKQ